MFKLMSVDILDSTCNFMQPFQFRIQFECHEIANNHDVEWTVIYVGSAESEEFDQTLLREFYGPFSKGKHSIILNTKPPNPEEIPIDELFEVAAVLVVGRYKKKTYFQIGYFVRNELTQEDLESKPDFKKIQRTVMKSLTGIQAFEAGTDDFNILQLEKLFDSLVL